MKWFKRRQIQAENVHGIHISGLSDFAVREAKDTILSICNTRCSDKVKIAALETIKEKFRQPINITGANVRMASD